MPILLTLLASFGLLSACARPTVTSQAEPETAPEDSTAYVISADQIQDSRQEVSEIIEMVLEGRASDVGQTNNMNSSGAIRRRHQEPIESLLQSRAPGVNVMRNPDGSISVRIRGVASLLASNDPLYIVDGSPFMTGSNGALTGINPNDIQSIEVLKYPPATSMYGVRGANGVIVITTNRPR